MEYTITDIDAGKGVVTITAKLRNGTVITDKRMMADTSSKEAITSLIEKWLVQHSDNIDAQPAKVTAQEITSLKSKVVITKAKEDAIKAVDVAKEG